MKLGAPSHQVELRERHEDGVTFGWDVVEMQATHGYLLSRFITLKQNRLSEREAGTKSAELRV